MCDLGQLIEDLTDEITRSDVGADEWAQMHECCARSELAAQAAEQVCLASPRGSKYHMYPCLRLQLLLRLHAQRLYTTDQRLTRLLIDGLDIEAVRSPGLRLGLHA